METQKKKITNAKDIGQKITKRDFKELTTNYINHYNDGETSFVIDADLITSNLTFNNQIAGIRFMYGLKDTLNPNSKVLFLIPCSNVSGNLSTEAMLKEDGYSDHLGNIYSFQDIVLMMSQYVQYVSKENPELVYKEITRGNFYGKNSLESLLTPNCNYIQYDLGYHENHISPIIQPLDENYNQVLEVYMDFTSPCPPCKDGSEELCMSELTLSNNEIELNVYRHFRDHHLLNLEGGAPLFELYYFVSPLVTKVMKSEKNKDVAIQKFYQEEIAPFKQLLSQGDHQEAVYALQNTLYKLFNEYEYSKVFA